MGTLPEQNQPYEMPLLLEEKATGDWYIDAPIVAGDFKVAIDFGTFVNVTNLPLAVPTGSAQVRLSMTAAEFGGNKVLVIGHDPDGLWKDIGIFFDLILGTVQTLIDIEEGDRTETSLELLIEKKDTSEVLIQKKIGQSLLAPDITLTTREP